MADFPPPPSDPVGPPPSNSPIFTLSPWSKRALAYLIDAAPVVAAYIVAAVLDMIIGLGLFQTLVGLASLAYWVWNFYRQGLTGQTIGKGIIGIKVVKEADASLLGPGVSIGRGFLHMVMIVICCIPGIVNFLFPLWDQKRQTLTDKILTTVVIDV